MLTTAIEHLPKTSPRTISRLKALGIHTYSNLLSHYPFRYVDFSRNSPIHMLQAGETITVRGKVSSFHTIPTRRKITIQKVTIADDTGTIELLWYNQTYLKSVLPEGTLISVSGEVEKSAGKLVMKPQEYEVLASLTQMPKHTGRIVPVYNTLYGLSSKTIREKIYYVLDNCRNGELPEIVPESFLKKYSLISRDCSIRLIHQPSSMKDVEQARMRLGFDELFIRILSSRLIKEKWKKDTSAEPINLDREGKTQLDDFIKRLPFTLTASQSQVAEDILKDLEKNTPMNRFLQGDVGSGKTVVAALASYATFIVGKQTLIMAPTEILATQHYQTISKLISHTSVRVALQTGSHKDIRTQKDASQYDIIIGTHALLSVKIHFRDVALVIIDEQHRFGVKQRAMLRAKGLHPHLLSMTATPIPRTVSLTLYSELDASIITEMPKGRKPVRTYVTPHTKRMDGYQWVDTQIEKDGVQAYIICPLIDASEHESITSVRAAKEEYINLKTKIFPHRSVALLHGKMKASEKNKVMQDFKEKKYDILVSTSVVEVGVDVPNATIMIIEGSERYGLAQLHQLRGRVGRGDHQSFCLLFTTSPVTKSSRLHYFAKTNSGLKLSEYDLKIRGPGDLYGTMQHGYSDMKIAEITNTTLVLKAKQAVASFMKSYLLDDFPDLQEIIDTHQLQLIDNN